MKKLALLLLPALLFCGCKANDNNPESDSAAVGKVNEEITTDSIDLNSLDETLCGYGQGKEVDENNLPLGAKQFNEQYQELDGYAYSPDSKKITLTFDQGYENGYTAKILDTLKEKKVSAVFFVLKDYAEKNPELIKRMIDEGHTVANHSTNHPSFPGLSVDDMKEEIMDVHNYIKDTFDYEMNLFRFPKGEYSEKALAVVKNCGYKSVFWSYAYEDWDTENQPDEAASTEKLVNAAHEGAIYLLHSVSETNANILGNVIDRIREAGFEFN